MKLLSTLSILLLLSAAFSLDTVVTKESTSPDTLDTVTTQEGYTDPDTKISNTNSLQELMEILERDERTFKFAETSSFSRDFKNTARPPIDTNYLSETWGIWHHLGFNEYLYRGVEEQYTALSLGIRALEMDEKFTNEVAKYLGRKKLKKNEFARVKQVVQNLISVSTPMRVCKYISVECNETEKHAPFLGHVETFVERMSQNHQDQKDQKGKGHSPEDSTTISRLRKVQKEVDKIASDLCERQPRPGVDPFPDKDKTFRKNLARDTTEYYFTKTPEQLQEFMRSEIYYPDLDNIYLWHDMEGNSFTGMELLVKAMKIERYLGITRVEKRSEMDCPRMYGSVDGYYDHEVDDIARALIQAAEKVQ